MHKLLLTGIAALVVCGTATAEDSTYLFVIPAERQAGDPSALGQSVRATLHVPDSRRAGQLISEGGALGLIATEEQQVTVTVGVRPTFSRDPNDTDLADTFVIDYLEPAVVAVTNEVRRSLGDRPTANELTDFVFDYIEDKIYLGNFDLASKIAATRSGDCTEHAVLLTALARATGHAARVAVGVVLIESGDQMHAFGHAWTEIHDGTRWQIADATRPEKSDTAAAVRYLPLINMDNEGPGFNLDLMRLAAIQPARISEIANASGAGNRY